MNRRKFFGASIASAAGLSVSTHASSVDSGERKLKVFATVADMKAAPALSINDHVVTQGYHYAGDGGHGEYIIVSSGVGVDDGGSYHELSNGNQAQLLIDGMINVKQFGAKGDGVTFDTDAIRNAVGLNQGNIFYPFGVYLTENFHRSLNILHCGDNAKWKVGDNEVAIPNTANETSGEMVIYVDANNGSDFKNNGLSADFAYKTIQYAYDSLPALVNDKCVIQLADGVYSENYLPDAKLPRKAMVFLQGKKNGNRTYQSGGVVNGSIIIRGNLNDKYACKILTTSSHPYGIYNTSGDVGLDSLVIEAGVGFKTHALLVSHRVNSYVYCINCTIDGASVGIVNKMIGAYTESGSGLEFNTGCVIKNCFNGVVSYTCGDSVTLSGDSVIQDCEIGVLSSSGEINISHNREENFKSITGCKIAIKAVQAVILVRGSSVHNRLIIDCPVVGEMSNFIFSQSYLEAENTFHSGCSIKFDNSGFQKKQNIIASNLWLHQSNSFISPATKNSDNHAIDFSCGSTLQLTAVNQIVSTDPSNSEKLQHFPESVIRRKEIV